MDASTSKNSPEKKKAPHLQPLLFGPLEADSNNYMRWSIDTKTHMTAEGWEGTLISPIPEGISTATKSWALVLLRRHLDTALQEQYIQIDDPAELWRQLAARFQHERTILLPQARNDWVAL